MIRVRLTENSDSTYEVRMLETDLLLVAAADDYVSDTVDALTELSLSGLVAFHEGDRAETKSYVETVRHRQDIPYPNSAGDIRGRRTR